MSDQPNPCAPPRYSTCHGCGSAYIADTQRWPQAVGYCSFDCAHEARHPWDSPTAETP